MAAGDRWKRVALGDVVTSLGGLWGKSEPGDGLSPVVVLRGTDFERARWLDLAAVPRRFEKQRAVGRRTLDPTCIVVETSGGGKDQPVGRSLLVTEGLLERAEAPLSAASFCRILWVDAELAEPRFVHGVLRASYLSGEIERFQSQSTGLRNLRTKQLLGDFRFGLPPIDEQRRIAAVLGALEGQIESNHRRAGLLERIVRSIYDEWFVRRAPEGRPESSAAEILCVNPRVEANQRQYRKVAMSDVSTSRSDVLPSAVVTRASGSRFVHGDVLFARITPSLENGKTALALFLDPGEVGVGSTEFIVLRGRTVGPAFAYCMARSEGLREHAIRSMSGGSGRQRVASDCFEHFAAPQPPPSLCASFERVAMPMLELVFRLRQLSERLEGALDLLLPRLVSGQVDVSDLDLGVLMPAGAR